MGQCQAMIRAIRTAPIMPAYRQILSLVSLVKGAQATTAIEGNTLTESEVREISEKKTELPPSKHYMQQEVRNVLDALNTLRDEIVQAKTVGAITPELVRRFHQLIGKDLGDHFRAIPGRFRNGNVTVAQYKAPDHGQVKLLMEQFCKWSREEFQYLTNQQPFSTAIIQAIVSHVYIAWIHPFGDGNGRTARMLEFYLLLRAGVPDIAAHILSNHYNETRPEYYRHLNDSSTLAKGNLTQFIMYALQGFHDGLKKVLDTVTQNQLDLAWRDYVREAFTGRALEQPTSVKRRQMGLVLSMDLEKDYPENEIIRVNEAIQTAYANRTKRTLTRDLQALLEMHLVLQTERGYRANTDVLRVYMARARAEGSLG